MKIIKHIYSILFLVTLSQAQILSPDKIQISGGMSFPSSPDFFYDYWKTGLGIQVEFVYSTESQFDNLISLEYNGFVFDEGRFSKRVGVENNPPKITGAAVSILSLGANIRYVVPDYEIVRPYISTGLEVMYSHVSRSTIDYQFSPVIVDARSNFLLTLPIGVYLEHTFKQKYEIFLLLKHNFKMLGNKDSHSNFSGIRIGFVFPLL